MAEDARVDGNGEASSHLSITPNISSGRLHIIIAGLWLCLFLSALDTTIIITALIRVSSDFNAFEQAAWLVTAYLLTYNAFLMITAKLSDIWGLKTLMITCAAIFLIFSMAAGGAQSMLQLIIFRAFQGIGGSGLYSLTFVSMMKIVVPEKIGLYSGIISSVFAVANLLGPLLGGIISDRTTWRWVFFINGPIMAIAIILLALSMPTLNDGKTHSERFQRLDTVGGVLSIGWPIPLIFALQEAGTVYAWGSPVIIGTLVAGIALFMLFGIYETWVTHKTKREPIFPIQLLRNPSMALVLLSMFLMGMPYYAIFVQLPQRFQVVNFTSAERAGILLLPCAMLTPVGSMIAGVIAKKVPVEIILITGVSIVCVGVGLLGALPADTTLWPGIYGYEIIAGLGLGLASTPYYMLIGTTVAAKDISVSTGALNTVRTLGGCIAVAICTAINREFTNDRLSNVLTPEQIAVVRESSGALAHLPMQVRSELSRIYGSSFNRQFNIMLAFTGLNIFVAVGLAMVRKKAGLYGSNPVPKEGNEFRKLEKTSDTSAVLSTEEKAPTEEAKPVPGKHDSAMTGIMDIQPMIGDKNI